MKQIDDYIDAICQDIDADAEELAEIKAEMRSHLLEAVEELRAQGKSEEESIYIALSRFGDHGDIQSGLKDVLQQQKHFAKKIFRVALSFLVVGLLFMTLFIGYTLYNDNVRSQADDAIQNLKNLLEENPEVTPKLKKEIKKTVDTFSHIHYVAVFDRDKLLSKTPPHNKITGEIVTVIKDPETDLYRILNEYEEVPENTDAAVPEKEQPTDKEATNGERYYLGFPNPTSKADFFYGAESDSSWASYGNYDYYWYRDVESEGDHLVKKRWIEVKKAEDNWWFKYNMLFALLIFGCFVVYWVLFTIWLIITAHHDGRLTPTWIVAFITLNLFAYLLYRSDQKRKDALS